MTQALNSKHKVTIYDEKTGEVISAHGEIELPKRKGRLRRGRTRMFAMLDTERVRLLQMTGSEWQIFMQLFAAMNRETGQSRMQVREIGKELNMPESSVSRSLKNLLRRRIVFREGVGIYRLSSHLAYRGAGDEWDTAEMLQPAPDLF